MRGVVQGVGFRPHVVRLARATGLSGWVRNDAEGVTIALAAPVDIARSFAERLASSLPPLARIDHVATRESVELGNVDGFRIEASRDGAPRTEVPPDAATCEACRAEVLSRGERRHRYPFATCTSCGPRYSIALAMPFDRDHTTLRGFPLCAACRAEYEDEDDRRYHAQAVACPACGPSVSLERAGEKPGEVDGASGDPLEAVADLLRAGAIVAAKGVGGYHLLCDATNDAAVSELRRRKQRDAKPFALLARDLDAVERYALVSEPEGKALRSTAAPVVLLPKRADASALSPHLAPRLSTLGFMLPSTPLQILIMEHLTSPVVCTSANVTDEPPCLDEASARARLASVADWFLHHDRPIAQRVDDSVVRSMAGRVRSLRRARGFAPAALASPPGFEAALPVLALGGQLKAAVCLTRSGSAVVSQHFGDLDDLRAFEDWKRGVTLLTELLEHRPATIAIDLHADYRSTAVGRELGEARDLRVEAVQHHHAHIAANLWEHGHPLDGPPVLGVAFDGLGQGEGGELWGGELLLCRYDRAERLRALEPVVLLGGDTAAREPWRNLYTHLLESMDWSELASTYGDLAVVSRLAEKPRALLEGVRASPSLSPPCSSAGRLFDAVAAALDVHFDSVDFEGQAAMELEALVDEAALTDAARGGLYPISLGEPRGSGPARWELARLWRALLDDLRAQIPRPVISARFHLSLAGAIAAGATAARGAHAEPSIVALSGGVFQNKVLVEATDAALRAAGFEVWLHEVLPPNDGCLALGQAAVVAARMVLAERQE